MQSLETLQSFAEVSNAFITNPLASMSMLDLPFLIELTLPKKDEDVSSLYDVLSLHLNL